MGRSQVDDRTEQHREVKLRGCLGLAGPFQHPWENRTLTPRHGADRVNNDGSEQSKARSLYDLTFSAPKSISIQAVVGGDERLVAAHDKAVREALEAVINFVPVF